MAERTPLRERARGHWKHLLSAVGGIDSRWLDGKHHPCPLCGGKDRWRFDNLKGDGTSICSQCGARNGIQLLLNVLGVDFAEAARRIEAEIGTDGAPGDDSETMEADQAAKHREAVAFWRSGQRLVAGDPVDRYLLSRVGHYPGDTRAIRCIQSTAFSGKTMPAMITAFVDVAGELAGIQRTFLTPDGEKYPGLESARWNTGNLPAGGAVRLVRPKPTDTAIGIAEGVETALSAIEMHGLPVWAALTANRLEAWVPPEGFQDVVVFGDADENYTGQAAAYALANRLEVQKKLRVQVEIPRELGTDWNDVLQQRNAAAA
ncbi:MAG TPA: toprim domain-containing protein [Devosia sp.]|jgi:putative DNA primase/helicase|nr:toprim domain-containing protein [Devosia sp.]